MSAAVASPLGLYVHVPFCATTCDFCAFYQTRPDAAKVRLYLDTVRAEADLVPRAGREVTSVFWGGGTPGLLAPRDLATLGAIVRGWAGGTPAEWSVELAPGSVTEPRLAALREAGVTRVSLGVQSFQPALLDALGRRHSLDQVHRAYERVRAAGFSSVNLDLMFALPGQDAAASEADLRAAIALAPDHLSTYCLTFEEDTALWVKLSQGRVKLDLALEERLYTQTWDILGEAGYAHYEVSNFARPGHACVHNLNTWRMHSWVGLGPAAASQHDGWRGRNVSDLAAWAAGVARGARADEDRVATTEELLLEDALIFGLRMVAGVDLAELRTRFPHGPWTAVEAITARLVEEGLAERDVRGDAPGGCARLRLTRRGLLVADAVGAEIMSSLAAGTRCPEPASP